LPSDHQTNQQGDIHMPGSYHIPGATSTENRQYEHIKESELDSGKGEKTAKRIAAATVNKERSERGETKSRMAMGAGSGSGVGAKTGSAMSTGMPTTPAMPTAANLSKPVVRLSAEHRGARVSGHQMVQGKREHKVHPSAKRI
jgi:hypothetical protein